MILIRVPDAARNSAMKAAAWSKRLKLHPLLANCLRLTVGTAGDNTLMLAALKLPTMTSTTAFPTSSLKAPSAGPGVPQHCRNQNRRQAESGRQDVTLVHWHRVFDHMLDQIAATG
jgi:hypothetical protein